MGGGKPLNPEDSKGPYLGEWGQFSPGGYSDAGRFSGAGGTQEEYNNLTPEQKAEYAEMLRPGGQDGHGLDETKARDFVSRVRGTPGAPAAAGPAARDPFMTAATPNVRTPFGSQNWSQDPATGEWTQTNELGGQLGGANDSIQAQWAEMLKQPMADGSAARDQAIDSAYKQSTSRLDPQWDKRMEAQRTQLLNQGLDPTSEAGKNAMSDMGLQRNDAYTSALASAVAQGTSAGNSVFQNNLAARNNPLQQLAGIKGLSQVGNNPTLLNALIAQKANELGLTTNLQNQQTDLAVGGMNVASNAIKGFL